MTRSHLFSTYGTAVIYMHAKNCDVERGQVVTVPASLCLTVTTVQVEAVCLRGSAFRNSDSISTRRASYGKSLSNGGKRYDLWLCFEERARAENDRISLLAYIYTLLAACIEEFHR